MMRLNKDDIKSTRAYNSQKNISVEEANIILRSRYLAYAESTWNSSAIRSLNLFFAKIVIAIFACLKCY
jgi:hypothetical protein